MSSGNNGIQAKPELIIQWERKTVKHQPKRRQKGEAWEWHFWRTTVAGVKFQYGKLSPSVWNFNNSHAAAKPDSFPGAHWEIWSDFGTEDHFEYMGYLFPVSENPEDVRAAAEDKVRAFISYRRDQLLSALEEIEHQPVNRQLQLV